MIFINILTLALFASGAKALISVWASMALLKPCPDKSSRPKDIFSQARKPGSRLELGA